MKKFLIKIFLILLPIFLLAIPLDWYLDKSLLNTHFQGDDVAVLRDIQEGKIEAEILVYGSSRAWVQFNPEIIKDSLNRATYNLGIDGHNFWLQYYRHREVMAHCKPPKYIFLSIDVNSLKRREDLFQLEQFLPFMYANKDLYEYLKVYKGYSVFDYIIPLWRYAGKTEALNAIVRAKLNPDSNKPIRKNGFQGNNKVWNSDLDYAFKKHPHYTVELHQPSIDLMHSFLKECKDLGIEVYMIASPEYYKGKTFVKNRAEIIDILKDIARQHNVPYIDFSDDEQLGNSTEYYYNSQHLNALGAELFTKKLMTDMKAKFPHLVKQ